MRYIDLLFEAAVPAISPQDAADKEMFGPIYHGTTATSLDKIIQTGFDPERSIPTGVGRVAGSFGQDRPTGTSHGYSFEGYGLTGIAAPVHHLGYGNYFTTVKAIAKQYSGGTMKGQREFYLDSKNVLEINFGSPNTMMKWWLQNGYDMTSEATKNHNTNKWFEATHHLTDNLKSKYDAVWFKGKGTRRLLDGDQLCVYRPELIRVIDPKLATGLQIGSKVTHSQIFANDFRLRNVFYVDDLRPDDWGGAGRLAADVWKGVFRADESDEDRENRKARGMGRYPMHFIPPPNVVGIITKGLGGRNDLYSVKWSKGVEMYNYRAEELKPYVKKTK